MVPRVEQVVAELRERLRRYPAARYPVQHATAQFHLGTALLQAGDAHEAATTLRASAAGFDPQHLPVEHAKALNMLGVALRDAGDLDAAAHAFLGAVAIFAEREQLLEEAAARFNVGLVSRDCGREEAAVDAFRRALELFDRAELAPQASAAARELGATLLTAGDAEGAVDILQRAADAAAAAGDHAALGSAANVLGLAHLASARPADAVEAFSTAASVQPRGVRPQEFAMTQANLALAYERLGDHARARLAARHALGVPDAPDPVVAQADAVVARLGVVTDDLFVVLDDEQVGGWAPHMRGEVARWAAAAPAERRTAARQWVDGQLARPAISAGLVEAWLKAVVELPPASMENVIADVVAAAYDRDPDARESFRAAVSSAVVRFHVPQWMRLKDTFNRAAAELGHQGTWV